MQPKLVCNLCAFPPIWDTTLRRAPSWHWMTKSHGSQKTRLLINGIFRERSWSKGEKCKKIINQKPQFNRVGSQRRSSHLWQQHSPRGRRETFPSWQQLSQGKTMDFLFSVALPTSFSSLWRLSPSLAVWGFGVALHSCRSQITILYCPSNHLCWRNIFSLFVLGQHQNDEDICKALHQRHLAKSKKSLQREKHLCMAWALGWFRKGVAQCAKWTVELYFHFWPTWDQEESQKLTLLACSVRTVFLSPFPHHLTSPAGQYFPRNPLYGSHGGRIRGLFFWAGPGHSAERFSFEGKGRTTSFTSMGSRKRKETSRGSPWGLVVRSSCTGKVSTGSFSWEPSLFVSQSGRYWTDPLGTALGGELVEAVFCCWGSSALEGFAGLWFTAAFSPLGVGAWKENAFK